MKSGGTVNAFVTTSGPTDGGPGLIQLDTGTITFDAGSNLNIDIAGVILNPDGKYFIIDTSLGTLSPNGKAAFDINTNVSITQNFGENPLQFD